MAIAMAISVSFLDFIVPPVVGLLVENLIPTRYRGSRVLLIGAGMPAFNGLSLSQQQKGQHELPLYLQSVTFTAAREGQ
jgi:hypothetical protein